MKKVKKYTLLQDLFHTELDSGDFFNVDSINRKLDWKDNLIIQEFIFEN